MIKEITDYPDYKISNKGFVLNKNGTVKKTSINNKGYHRLTLSKNGYRVTYSLHALVALHFVPNPNNYYEINHKDGNKSNNAANNLEWVTGSMNIKHAYSTGLKSAIGVKNGRAKLTELDVIKIKKLVNTSTTLKDIASQFNISPNVISEIKRGIKWKHIVL